MKSIRVFLLGTALLVGTVATVVAQPPELAVGKAGKGDVVERMLADGWKIVSEGILQKHHDDGKVETWGYGVDGRQWHVQQLEKELGQMLVDYETAPTKALARAIEVHWELLDHSRGQLQAEIDHGPFQPVGGDRAMNKAGCTVSYSWNASASPNAVASANAAWSHSCGEQASTYAYAYAKKVYNGTTTQFSQTDPKGPGSNVSSLANASVSGGADTCYATARAYVDPPESAFYEITDTNSTCAVPLTASISGWDSVYLYGSCQSVTWSVTPSGGAGTRSYQWRWNNTVVGTNSTSYTRNVCAGDSGMNTLKATVTDSTGSVSPTKSVYVEYEFPDPCIQYGYICP